jgi:carotenoid cleavage dioxygenase-like enzyme
VACGQPAMLRAPRFIYRVVSKEGLLGVPVPITMPHACLMHDFAITENYAIFMDLPLGLNLLVHRTLFFQTFSEATVGRIISAATEVEKKHAEFSSNYDNMFLTK